MKATLFSIGCIGLFLFGLCFILTFSAPGTFEESAKEFVKQQIEKEIKEKYQEVKASSFVGKVSALVNQFGYHEQQLREAIENGLPEKIGNVLARMCGYDCEKKKSVIQSIKNTYLEQISNYDSAQERLKEIIKNKYLTIFGNLKSDLRIFLGSNTLVFSLLLLISALKPRAFVQLSIPGILLFIATIVSVALYVFGQDWFYTLVYNDFMGWGYLAYIGVIFCSLTDIVFNKARVTTEVVNFYFNLIGSAISASPC